MATSEPQAPRGAGELVELNRRLFDGLNQDVRAGRVADSVQRYKNYLNRRNASYMRLEGNGEARSDQETQAIDPFAAATGYHRIAIETMTGLLGSSPKQIVLNVPNNGAVPDLQPTDIVEVPCLIDRNGPRPLATGPLPQSVRGLVISVKEYERLAIRAAVEGSLAHARLAMLVYPVIGEWEPAERLLAALVQSDPEHLGYLH